jgi:hypothetical protein
VSAATPKGIWIVESLYSDGEWRPDVASPVNMSEAEAKLCARKWQAFDHFKMRATRYVPADTKPTPKPRRARKGRK